MTMCDSRLEIIMLSPTMEKGCNTILLASLTLKISTCLLFLPIFNAFLLHMIPIKGRKHALEGSYRPKIMHYLFT